MIQFLQKVYLNLYYKFLDFVFWDSFEMGYLYPKQTGLDFIVYISGKEKSKYGPRVKMSNVSGAFDHKRCFIVTAENPVRIISSFKLTDNQINTITKWMSINRESVEYMWNNAEYLSDVADVLFISVNKEL